LFPGAAFDRKMDQNRCMNIGVQIGSRQTRRESALDHLLPGPYILMGKLLEKKGGFDLAVRALQRAVAMDPNDSITHHLLGQPYRDLGRNEDAERELKLAEQLQERDTGKQ
jgi:Flp pilus assembly protein TadD